MAATLTREGAILRKFALGYPEASEEMPWGHHAIKVKGKTFVFLAVAVRVVSSRNSQPGRESATPLAHLSADLYLETT